MFSSVFSFLTGVRPVCCGCRQHSFLYASYSAIPLNIGSEFNKNYLFLQFVDNFHTLPIELHRFHLHNNLHSNSNYMSSSFHKFQSIHSLIHIVNWWRNVTHNESKSITRQWILQQSGQLALSEGRYCFVFTGKTGDNFAQSSQRLIYIL